MPQKYICPECNEPFGLNDIEYKCSKHPLQKMESSLFEFILGNTPSYCPKCKTKSDYIKHNYESCNGCSYDIINPAVLVRRICLISPDENERNIFKQELLSEIKKKYLKYSEKKGRDSVIDYSPQPEYISFKDFLNKKDILLVFYSFPAEQFEALIKQNYNLKSWAICITQANVIMLFKDSKLNQDIYNQVSDYLGTLLYEEKETGNIDKYPDISEISFETEKVKDGSLRDVSVRYKTFSETDTKRDVLNWIIGVNK